MLKSLIELRLHWNIVLKIMNKCPELGKIGPRIGVVIGRLLNSDYFLEMVFRLAFRLPFFSSDAVKARGWKFFGVRSSNVPS